MRHSARQPISFTYFANGLRKTMADPSGTTSYSYDNRNRLTQKQTPEGTLNYTYDAAGNLLTLKSANSGGISDVYTYDAQNRLASAKDAAGETDYRFDSMGNLADTFYPIMTTSYAYDKLNRLTQVNSGGAANYVYTLGAAGNRVPVTGLP